MREELIRRELYGFVKTFGVGKGVRLSNIRRFSDSKGISRREMGLALQSLRNDGNLYFIPLKGWYAR